LQSLGGQQQTPWPTAPTFAGPRSSVSRAISAFRLRRCASTCVGSRPDEGLRPDLPTSEEREEIKQLRREVYELRRANEILKAASVFFATELDADRPK
jgi:transposase-like protein